MNHNIYKILKERILYLEYQPGEIINEKVLTKEFGISRTPLREVLNRLEWDQLVRILPRTGTMVAEIEFQKMMYTFQVRFEIEELVAKLAADNITDEQIAHMEDLLAKCQLLTDIRNRKDLIGIDIDFRKILFDAANNPVLESISNQLYNTTIRLWYTIMEKGAWEEEVQAMCHEISATKEACKSGEVKKISSLRRENLSSHFDRIRSKFFRTPQS